MSALKSAMLPLLASVAVIGLDINGYLTGQEFLSALAQLISSLLLGLFSLLVFGDTAVS